MSDRTREPLRGVDVESSTPSSESSASRARDNRAHVCRPWIHQRSAVGPPRHRRVRAGPQPALPRAVDVRRAAVTLRVTVPARRRPPGSRDRLSLRQCQRRPARQQDVGPDGARFHACRGAPGRLRSCSGAGGRWRHLAVARFLRPESPSLFGDLRSARAAVRLARAAAGVPAPVDGRPDLLLHQLAAGRGADDPHAEAGAGPVRLGSRGLAPQCRWRQSRRSPGTAHRPGGGLHPGTGFIGRSMRRRFSGPFTPSIIRQRRWTGWPGHACTWST